MRAVFFTEHGGPDVLEEGDLPDPKAGAGEVRVKVKACAMNHLDLWVRNGWPGLKLPMPHVLGADIAGVVESVGPGVGDVAPGAEVLLSPSLSCGACAECLSGRDNHCRSYTILGEGVAGGYAELVAVPRRSVHPKPKNLSFEEAACVPLVFLTAFHMLVDRAAVKRDETVLVVAAGSGVGSAALQIARDLGARVIATAGSDAKLAKARELGANEVVNHTTSDLYAEVRRITGKRGVDVVFEHVGSATWAKSMQCLAHFGRLVTCGATTGYDAALDLRHLFMKQLTVLGSTMGTHANMFEVFRRASEGRYKPVLDRAMPLSQARKAHELLADRVQFGKIVLVP